jgi:S-disulfanyl-L-cysteine oxidoreductase SoxD
MFRPRPLVAFCFVAGGVLALAQQLHYGVARPANPEQIRARDISVAPDGTGLPAGRGTAARGRALFAAKCASCHGERGKGSADFPALSGGRGTLDSHVPVLTVGSYWPCATTVWDYIHRAMPYQNPGSLTPDEVYSITAYVLFMNQIVGEREELNETTLPEVKMPNRNGFIPDPRPDVKSE